jgi:hypothetical protein
MSVFSIHLVRLTSVVLRVGSGWDLGHAPAGARLLVQFISAASYPPPRRAEQTSVSWSARYGLDVVMQLGYTATDVHTVGH